MGDVISIKNLLRNCDNCKWLGSGRKGCLRPGGWRLNAEHTRCIDFEREFKNDKNR